MAFMISFRTEPLTDECNSFFSRSVAFISALYFVKIKHHNFQFDISVTILGQTEDVT